MLVGYSFMKGSIRNLTVTIILMCQMLQATSETLIHKNVNEGDSFDLLCCEGVNGTINSISIHTPKGNFYPVLDGLMYEKGKIMSLSRQLKCGVNVKDANIIDQGVWVCNVQVQNGANIINTQLTRHINVTLVPHEVLSTQESVNTGLMIGILISVVLLAVILSCTCKWLRNKRNQNTIHSEEEGTEIKEIKTAIEEVKTEDKATKTETEAVKIESEEVKTENEDANGSDVATENKQAIVLKNKDQPTDTCVIIDEINVNVDDVGKGDKISDAENKNKGYPIDANVTVINASELSSSESSDSENNDENVEVSNSNHDQSEYFPAKNENAQQTSAEIDGEKCYTVDENEANMKHTDSGAKEQISATTEDISLQEVKKVGKENEVKTPNRIIQRPKQLYSNLIQKYSDAKSEMYNRSKQ